MKDLDVNTAVWGIFMSVTLLAAVHHGKDYTKIFRSTNNHTLKSLKQLFQVTPDQTEITGLITTDRAVQSATAKTYVFAGSVLSGRYQ